MIEKLKYSSLSDSMFNILRLKRLIVIHLKMQMAFKIRQSSGVEGFFRADVSSKLPER